MALTPEEIERRRAAMKGNKDSRSDRTRTSDLILNWHSGKTKMSTLDMILAPFEDLVFVNFSRYMYQERVFIKGKDGDPDRYGLFFRNFNSHESVYWHQQYRFTKQPVTRPVCPLAHLREYIKANPNQKSRVIFRFGEGCTLKNGKPLEPTEVFGSDLVERSTDKDGWRRAMLPQSRMLYMLIPVALNHDGDMNTWDEPEYKIVIESFNSEVVHQQELMDASTEHGDDFAGNFARPAVYRWSYNMTAPNATHINAFGSRFMSKLTSELDPKFIEHWEGEPSEEIRDAVNEASQPGDVQKLYKALSDAFVGDFDLAEAMHVIPDNSEPEVEATSEPPPKANGKRRTLRKKKVEPPPPADDSSDLPF